MENEAVDDVVAITPTAPVKVAAACTILSGVLGLVLALQAGAMLQVRGPFQAVVVVFALLGVSAIVWGYRLSRLRGGAALWSVISAGILSLGAIGWFVLALMNGVFILLALFIVPVASIGAITSLLSLKNVERAEAARGRLRAQGLDAGL